MPHLRIPGGLVLIFLAVVSIAARSAAAQQTTQTFDLRPGWNAIYLEVEPAVPDIDVVFDGLPVAAVWAYVQDTSTAEFERQIGDAPGRDDVWLHFEPANPDRTTLHAVTSHTGYLVNLEGPGNRPLTVRGVPVVKRPAWIPSAFNLRGFPIDPDHPPAIEDYFAHSDSLGGQTVHRLDADGKWKAIEDRSTTLERGVAYWIFCKGQEENAAPFDVVPGSGERLEFPSGIDAVDLEIRNASPLPRSIELRDLAGDAGRVSLVRPRPQEQEDTRESLQRARVDLVGPLTSSIITLAVDRANVPEDGLTTVIEVSDRLGTLWQIPVTIEGGQSGPEGLWVGTITVDTVQEAQAGVFDAQTTTDGGSDGAPARGVIRFLGDDNDLEFRARRPGSAGNGLTVHLRRDTKFEDDVAEVDYAPAKDPLHVEIRIAPGVTTAKTVIDAFNGERVLRDAFIASAVPGPGADGVLEHELSPVARPFTLRLVLHVDAAGRTTLLEEAFQMFEEGGTITDPDTGLEVPDPEKPGRSVLLTDPDELGRFRGTQLRNGELVGRRISSIGFDFPGRERAAESGIFGPGRELRFEIDLPADHPTNPYRHRRHPDHDGKDVEGNPDSEEAFRITRSLRLLIDSSPPPGRRVPGFGASVFTGRYVETLGGLHRQPLVVSGNVQFRRVVDTARLGS